MDFDDDKSVDRLFCLHFWLCCCNIIFHQIRSRLWIICGLAINIVLQQKKTHRLIDRLIDRSFDRWFDRWIDLISSVARYAINDGKKGKVASMPFAHLLTLCPHSVEADSACWSFDKRLNVKRTLWPSIRFALWTITIRSISSCTTSKKRRTKKSKYIEHSTIYAIHLNILPWKRHLNIDITWIDYMIYTFVAGPKAQRLKKTAYTISFWSLWHHSVGSLWPNVTAFFCIHFVPNINAHRACTRPTNSMWYAFKRRTKAEKKQPTSQQQHINDATEASMSARDILKCVQTWKNHVEKEQSHEHFKLSNVIAHIFKWQIIQCVYAALDRLLPFRLFLTKNETRMPRTLLFSSYYSVEYGSCNRLHTHSIELLN